MKKKIVLFVIIAALAINLIGCGAIKSIFSDKEDLNGEWKMEADVTDIIKGQLESSLNTTITTDAKFRCYTVLTLNEDGTFSYKVDKEKTEASMHEFVDEIVPNVEEYIYNMLAEQGIDKEAADQIFETEKGMSIREYVSQQLSVMELNMTASNAGGYYKATDTNIYFASTKDGLTDCKDYYIYNLNGNTLTFSEGYGKYSKEAAKYPVVMPMEFHKD